MKTFQYNAREYVSPIDLSILSNTYNTLEQGHKEAVKAASDLEVTMANLDLNEAEAEWRQQKINQIKQTIDDNTIYGNSYGALDDIIATAGSLASDQGMIGRLQAQKDYKTFIENVDKSELPQDYKDFFKDKNPYYYQDKIDEKTGKVISGTKWTPVKSPTKTIPLNELMNQALKWAAAEKGGGSATRWLDANGNVTSEYSESVTGEIFNTTTNQWERLSKDKLRQALNASIQSTPGAKESLHQDWEVAKWKYDKEGYNPDIVDKNGKILNEQEYLEKRINPFFDAASYYNQTSKTEYGDAVKSQLALRKTQTDNVTNHNLGRIPDVSTTLSNPITIKNVMPSQASAAITAGKQTIADILGKDVDITKMTNDEILNLAANRNVTSSDMLKINMALDAIQENQDYINSIKQGLSKDEQAQFDVYNAIISLSDLPEVNKDNEKYIKKWQDFINGFYNGGTAIRQYYSDEDGVDAFYTAIGGKDAATALGVREGTANGKRYVELPSEYSKSLYSFGKAAKAANAETHNFFGAGWNRFKNKLNSDWGDNIVRINSDGSESSVLKVKDTDASLDITSSASVVYNKMLNYIDGLQRTNDNIIGNSGNLTLSNNIINAESPAVAEVLAIRKYNPEEASKYTQVLNDEQKEVFKAASNLDLVQTGAFVLGEDNTLREISSEERKKYTALLRSADSNDLDIVAIQDPKSGNWGTQITIKGYTNDEGKITRDPVTFYVPGGINSQIYESWNRDTNFKAKNDVNTYGAAGRTMTIASSNMFGIDKNIKLVPNGSGFTIKEGDREIKRISDEEAINLRDNYYMWQYTYNNIISGEAIDGNAVNAIATKISVDLAKIFNPNDNGELAAYYYGCLTNALK